MELKNKKIAFLGDSITEGHGVADKNNIVIRQRFNYQFLFQAVIDDFVINATPEKIFKYHIRSGTSFGE